jgi:hypothetical protein
MPAPAMSAPDKRQNVGVDHIGVRRRHAMRIARICFERAVLQQLDGCSPRCLDRRDLVVLAMHYQHRLFDRLQIGGEIAVSEGRDAVVLRLDVTDHCLAVKIVGHRSGDFRARAIKPIKRPCREVAVELRTIAGDAGADAVDRFRRHAIGIARRFSESRGDRADFQAGGPMDWDAGASCARS